MKTHYFINFLVLILSYFVSLSDLFSQNILLNASTNGTTVTTCSGYFYDSGGSGGNYSDNENYTITFQSSNPCLPVALDFTALNIENSWDYLYIYDGPDTGSPLIRTLTGNTAPGLIISSGTSLTIRFTSDGSVNYSGWTATILTCGPLTYEGRCNIAKPITTISGANFSFSTPPSDGAIINPSTGVITNGTMGATYQVYDACSNRSATVNMQATEPCYALFDDAVPITVNGNTCIQLTPEQSSKTGCAWSEQTVDFNSNFSLSLDYYFGDNVNGADGTTFTFQPNPNAECGEDGSQLGAGGIPNALVVEFDTYDNDDNYQDNDPSYDHIAIEIDGELVRNDWGASPPLCGPVAAISGGGSIEDGNTHHIEIKWNAATQTLEVYFDNNLRLSCNHDFVNTVFAGQNVMYWGATGATGGLINQQYFCPETVVILGATVQSFDVKCQNNELIANWQTKNERTVERYEIQYTHDGYIYQTYASVLPAGNNMDDQYYNFSIQGLDPQNTYFRIKIVDKDESILLSETVVAQNCEIVEEIITKYKDDQLSMVSKTKQEFNYKIIDINGKLISYGTSIDGMAIQPISLLGGVYFTMIQYENGSQINQKLVIH